MLIPLSWLKEYIDINLEPEALADVLTEAGLEVEKIEKISFGFTGIVVGKVVKAAQHPDAEKLRVATVSDGAEEFQVVCGAPNCKEGLVTAFAKTGSTLTDEDGKTFKIKKSKLRGVESFGMLCSEKELGLSSEYDEIMDIGDQALIGKSMQDLYGDIIFEISLTPNLGHCMSIRGIAREVAALVNTHYETPKVSLQEAQDLHTGEKLSVSVEDQENCLRYAARYLENVEVKPSPDFIIERLEASGLRPVNNIVDITNYVLLEYGQPLHAFDYDRLEGSSIKVTQAEKECLVTTLDEVERKVLPGTLLIEDSEKPIAVAGVMGCLNTSVTENTTRIALESAYFDASCVRRSSKSLNLRTDASSRFEKSVDHEAVVPALNRATQLMQEYANARVATEIIDEKFSSFAKRELLCRLTRVNKILGTKLSLDEVDVIFKRLRMETKVDLENESFQVTIPSFRNDITAEIDLIEEVARVYGYNNIEIKQSKTYFSNIPHCNFYLVEKEVRKRLIAEGLQESLTCDLISPKLARLALGYSALPDNPLIHVLQPSSVDQSIMRPSLLPGMLQMIRHNFDHKTFSLSNFEIGLVHYKQDDSFHERAVAGIVLTGENAPHFWEEKTKEVDFFDLKGIVENLAEGVHIDSLTFTKSKIEGFHPGKQATIESDDANLGIIGEVHPNILSELSIDKRVFFAEIDLQALFKASKIKELQMKPLPQFPGTERDWTITATSDTALNTILDSIHKVPSRLLKDVHLRDLYTSEKLGKDKKNITLRFTYRDDKKTIAFETADREHARILAGVKSKLSDEIVND